MGWRGVLGFEYGIVQAPLGPDISGPELVAAVANAGGLGFLRAPDTDSPDIVRELIRKTRALTEKPFGIGVILAFPHENNIKAILEENVAMMQVSWGELTKELVLEAHSAGVKVINQVGDLEEVGKAVNAGVDAIIVQGVEAGGHILGKEGLMTLLPRAVEIVGDQDIVVIAAGGICDERGYVAALALGAHAVCLGTRFVATLESYAHPAYKKKLVELGKTQYTTVFGRSRWAVPHRVLQTPSFIQYSKSNPDHKVAANQPIIGHTTIHGTGTQICRFGGTVPNATTTGDIESMVMYAGEGVGLVKEILPAGEIIRNLVTGAQLLIQQKLMDTHD